MPIPVDGDIIMPTWVRLSDKGPRQSKAASVHVAIRLEDDQQRYVRWQDGLLRNYDAVFANLIRFGISTVEQRHTVVAAECVRFQR